MATTSLSARSALNEGGVKVLPDILTYSEVSMLSGIGNGIVLSRIMRKGKICWPSNLYVLYTKGE